uniref:Uncharacterized protein n=1 Tax=Romanomermis culicivorax TaxID=13658 RepID=A0A915JKQ4_ROMCU
MREVDNRMGKQFTRYISFALMNSQSYVIDTTSLMEKELVNVSPYQYDFTLRANHDQFAKRVILTEELRYAALNAYYPLLIMFAAIYYDMADYLLMQMQVLAHDRMEPKQVNTIALYFYQQYLAIPGHINLGMGLGSQVMETDQNLAKISNI